MLTLGPVQDICMQLFLFMSSISDSVFICQNHAYELVYGLFVNTHLLVKGYCELFKLLVNRQVMTKKKNGMALQSRAQLIFLPFDVSE